MKAKYFVITVLSILLVWIVYKMMLYESSIRETRIVTVKGRLIDEPGIGVEQFAHARHGTDVTSGNEIEMCAARDEV